MLNDENFISRIKLKTGELLTIRDDNAVTKEYVDKYFSGKFMFQKVDNELPEIGDPHLIYLKTRSSDKEFEQDKFDEYIYLEGENKWEKLGSLDLSDYVKIEKLGDLVVKSDAPIRLFEKKGYNVQDYNIETDKILLKHTIKEKDECVSITISELVNLITNNVYNKQDNRPISSNALLGNNFIKYREIPIKINRKYSSSSSQIGEELLTIKTDLQYEVSNSQVPKIGLIAYDRVNGSYKKLETSAEVEEYSNQTDITYFNKIEIDQILGITVNLTNETHYKQDYIISNDISIKSDHLDSNMSRYILTSTVFAMKNRDINGNPIEYEINDLLGTVRISYI